VLLLVAAVAYPGTGARAQDQELMARIYGTRLPDGHLEFARSQPQMFDFARALRSVGARAAAARAPVPGPVDERGWEAVTAAAPVSGTYRIAAVIGLFAGGPASPVSPERLQREFFSGPNSYYRTVTDYFHEMSGGLLTVTGTVFDTVRSSLTLSEVMGKDGCLTNADCRLGQYIRELLEELDARGVDWGLFDNDGPDGIPNSGDDDGFVDVLAVFHPEIGNECGGPGPWARRAQLAVLPPFGGAYQTRTPSNAPGGGTIRINDLVLQSVRSCRPGRDVTEIGVFVHELGHALGLPDLYDAVTTDGTNGPGIGSWGLMGTGAWGCGAFPEPERPCGMGAWTREQLGWVDVVRIPPGEAPQMVALGAVADTRRVFRIDSGDGSREYYLLETRRRVGFDEGIPGEGLLVWHIDQDVVDAGWPFNRVNANPARYGVALVEADGQGNLRRNEDQAGSNRGDAGDPFPGSRGNREFHAGSTPGSLTHQGWASGLTLREIEFASGESRFELSTRFGTVAIGVEGVESARITIDGRRSVTAPIELPWAPFERRTLAADPGRLTGPGTRVGAAGWSDGAPRERVFTMGFGDTALTVRYEKQYRLSTAVRGPATAGVPGRVTAAPEGVDCGWYAPGAAVEVTATANTGFGFERWEGVVEGGANPVRLTLDTAMSLTAVFRQTFAAESPGAAQIRAADSVVIELRAVNGTPPLAWTLVSGALPAGLQLRNDGRIVGAALETGTFPVSLRVRDAAGLTATLDLPLEVLRPALGLDVLLAPLLGTASGPDAVAREYLDRQGNRNGTYDVGDLRAYLLAHPDLPMTAEERAIVRTLVPEVVLPGRWP